MMMISINMLFDDQVIDANINLALISLKTVALLIYIGLNIIQFVKVRVMEYLLQYQADFALLTFAVMSLLKLEWTLYDLGLIMSGLYLILPQVVLIAMSENWKRSLTWFVLLTVYPSNLTRRFEEKYLLEIERQNQFDEYFIVNRLAAILIFFILLLMLTMYKTQSSRHEEYFERKSN